MELDPDLCYRAIATRDPRFDGQFFTAVRTTRVYCRPTCPAPTPKRENCTFFRHAAAAQAAGFRPCLRCRPELAPDLFAALGPSGVVARALRLIAAGALDDGTVGDLAHRVGVTARHLSRLCVAQLGASPVAIAHNRRLLFAKQLIEETNLPFADLALAAGFRSIRRFNTVIQATYARSPRQLRHNRAMAGVCDPYAAISLRLAFSPPYDWPAIRDFLACRAIPGVELVQDNAYQRTIALDGAHGLVTVRPVPAQPYLQAIIRFPKIAALGHIAERLRQLFDLHANGRGISAQLQADPLLAPLMATRPGARVPGAWDGFELAVRAILGQQVSVAAASTFAGRLATAFGEPLALPDAAAPSGLSHVFPTPIRLANADLTTVGVIRARAVAINALATAVASNPQWLTTFRDLGDALTQLTALPGIGMWTAHYIAMRALRESDAFPSTDLGLLRAMARLGHPISATELACRAEAWRPWRAYAAMLLWQSEARDTTQDDADMQRAVH